MKKIIIKLHKIPSKTVRFSLLPIIPFRPFLAPAYSSFPILFPPSPSTIKKHRPKGLRFFMVRLAGLEPTTSASEQ